MTYEEFYLKYHRFVFKRILDLCRDHHTAEDLAQNAWLKIWRFWPLKHEEHVTAYLWKVASRVVYDWHRRAANHPHSGLDALTDMESQDADPAVCVTDSLTHDRVFWQCWSRLRPDEREALRSLFRDEETTDRQSLYRARRNIKTMYARAISRAEKAVAR